MQKMSSLWAPALIVTGFLVLQLLVLPGETEALPPFTVEDSMLYEVLLNREDIEYDLSPLEKFVDEGLANKVEGTGLFGAPLNSYVLKSHSHPEIGVVVSETDNSFLSILSGTDVDMKGLSVSLIIPTKLELVSIHTEEIRVPLDGNSTLDDTLVPFMEGLGYSGGAVLNTTSGETGVVDSYSFIRGNITIILYPEDSPAGMATSMNNSVQAIGYNVSLTGTFEAELKQMLNFTGTGQATWNNRSYIMRTEEFESFVPDISGDISDFKWQSALRQELEILRNWSVISGLTDEDLQGIEEVEGEGFFGLIDVVIHSEGDWTSLSNVFDRFLLSLWPVQHITSVLVPEGTIPYGPEEQGETLLEKYLVHIIIASGVLIAAVSATLFFTRLKTNSLLDNANRNRIVEVITGDPGIHFRKLSRIVELKQGVLSYHLNVLEKNELVKSVQDGNNRRFYLYDQKVKPEMFLTDLQRSIVQVIYDSPGISQSKISKQLGRSKALVNYHLRILREANLVNMEKERGVTSCYPAGNVSG
ncbi:MAG: winged helix-turn-helix transcriptional regulator [Thermoplasmatota archaeon]